VQCTRPSILVYLQNCVLSSLDDFYATYAVLDENVSPPYTQPVSSLQWEGLTFLFKDALYPVAGQEDIECKVVDQARYRQWTDTRYYKVYSYTAYFKKALPFADNTISYCI